MVITGNKRYSIILVLFLVAALALLARAVYLQHHNQARLQREADNRHLRTVGIPARRGMITDRNGEPLAVSTPVYDVWVDPLEFDLTDGAIGRLSAVLDIDPARLRDSVESRRDKRFVYVKRHVKPLVGKQVVSLSLLGVGLSHKRQRFYPMSEAAAHLIGVTNLDGVGIEGVEKQFDEGLRGVSGKKKVLRNRHGDIFENVALVSAKEGKSLALTIDHNLQYHAYKTLATAVKQHDARGGAVVLLDSRSGEVLAMVNYPSFNPNTRESPARDRRNMALIDAFEPGSTAKPLVVATLLSSGHASLDRVFDTDHHQVAGKRIVDISNYGPLTLSEIVIKSSNVGMSKAVLQMPAAELWQSFRRLDFGQILGTGFPGETSGHLSHHLDWTLRDRVGLSFGYGVSVTLLHLAYAYTALANSGWRPALSLVKGVEITEKTQLFTPEIARAVRQVLERVVSEGTGKRARIDGFRVAGKTGTTHKSKHGKYASDRYLSLFVGFAPVSDPRLVAAVMLDEPGGQEYFGGAVAAPVFSQVMQYALRRLNVPRDDIEAPARDDKSYILANE